MMCSCAKFLVILLITSGVASQTDKNTTRTKQDTSQIKPRTKPHPNELKGTYRIIENEIPKGDDYKSRGSEVDTQTPVTLIFLNAAYVPKEITTLDPRTHNLETTTTEENHKIVQPSFYVEEPTSELEPLVTEELEATTTAKPCQRGILDMLFPAERVELFKSYFEALKRFLSARF